MHINLTVPLTTDGFTFGEIECQIDVRVTYAGHDSYFIRGAADPGADPEFEIDAYYVDCGTYQRTGFNRSFKKVENWYAAPVNIIPFIDAYVDGEGRADVIDGIKESV